MLPTWNTSKGEGSLPPYYCVVDIETADPTPEDLEMEKRFMKNGNLKDPEKIRAKQDAIRGGLTDSAPIFCIGIKTPDKLAVFSWGKLSREEEALLMSQGILGITAVNEIDMMLMFAAYLNSLPENTRFITWNGEHFDLPKLRMKYAKYDVENPKHLFYYQHTDLMLEFKKFSVADVFYPGLEYAAEKLGVPFHKALTGAQVPEFVRDGRHCEVILYNALDCLVEEQIARKLLRGKI